MLTFLCVSCADTESDPLSYQNGNIRAEISILKNGCRIGALLYISDSGDASLTLTSPETVAGTEIKRIGGAVSVTGCGLSFESSDFISAAELFMLDGYVSSAELAELGGKKLTRLYVEADGEKYEVYLSDRNTPVRILSERLTVDIIWFEAD